MGAPIYKSKTHVTDVVGKKIKNCPPTRREFDVYGKQWVLHDWSIEDCIKILKKCKEAIPSKENGGRVIVIELVMDQNKDDKSYETQLFLDMLMMVDASRKERSEQEWAKLFLDADFSDYNIILILGLRLVIEVYP
uniref:O-methyltransferase n=1 Tax=Solanum tuberosum TaxID=4113 RepID=M1CUQ6_SOLTU